MKKFTLLTATAAAALLAVSSPSMAADMPTQPVVYDSAPVVNVYRWYVRGDAGIGFFDGQGGDEAWTLGGGLGYRWSENFRTDLTLDYTGEYDLNNGRDAEAWSVLANGYVDLPINEWLKPYVGLGVGYGDVQVDGGNDDDGLALAAYTGLTFDVTRETQLDVGYRYRNISVSGPDFEDHSIRAGFRFNF